MRRREIEKEIDEGREGRKGRCKVTKREDAMEDKREEDLGKEGKEEGYATGKNKARKGERNRKKGKTERREGGEKGLTDMRKHERGMGGRKTGAEERQRQEEKSKS